MNRLAGPGSFIVLVGIDGSGKSTLLERLAEAGVRTSSWNDLRSHDVPAMLAPDAPTAIKARLTPLARSMFIGGHLVAQYEYLVRPALEQGDDVLLDSYYFKLLAKERLLGFVQPALEELCRQLPQPDGLILIDTPPELSWSRKAGTLSVYEHFGTPTETNYLAFQRGIETSLRKAGRAFPSVTLDGRQTPSALADSALIALETLATKWKVS